MTLRDYFDRVWDGLRFVERLGMIPITINVVLMRGINDDEIVKFGELARTKPFIIRFIEFMPIGADDGWTPDQVISANEVIHRMEEGIGQRLQPVERRGAQPADRYRFADGVGEIGFISPVSEPFCDHCNRVWITSDGKFRTCLFSLEETDLKHLLRSDQSDHLIQETIVQAVRRKEAGHRINTPEFVRPARTMSQIGG